MTNSSSGLKYFLTSARSTLSKALTNRQPVHVFIGNEAADPDSIVSSLCSAYMGSTAHSSSSSSSSSCVPMCCIPRADLKLRRDTELLFTMAGLDINDLICLEDAALVELSQQGLLTITLTDHNELATKWGSGEAAEGLSAAVVGIIDHHLDKGKHAQVTGERRNIAFDSITGCELAGSACTLVAEMFLTKEGAPASIEEEVATLLSGVILLDTSNMNPVVGKGKPRDEIALNALLAALPGGATERRDATFSQLQSAKTDATF